MQEQIEFIIPDGYIKDEENTTDKKAVYKLEKKPLIAKNWDEVCNVMFSIGYEIPYLDASGFIDMEVVHSFTNNKNNLTSETQGKKLMAINQLMTVAKYLNGLDCFGSDYKPVTIHVMPIEGLRIFPANTTFIFFNNKERASQAIKILGEDVIRLALTPNNY